MLKFWATSNIYGLMKSRFYLSQYMKKFFFQKLVLGQNMGLGAIVGSNMGFRGEMGVNYGVWGQMTAWTTVDHLMTT